METRIYKPQQFNLSGLNGISDQTLEMHFKLYEGYVKATNELNARIAAILADGRVDQEEMPAYSELTRRLGFEYNGMILHEYYFSNLRAGASPRPGATSAVAQALAEAFGSVEDWRKDFQAIGGLRGVGWVLLCEDPMTRRLTNHWVSLHQNGVLAGFKPLLVLDVWEHAFMRDYKATERGRYLDAFFRNIDWHAVERRLIEPMAIRPAAAA
jgi:superoxide dismutase, Fe-Mn family